MTQPTMPASEGAQEAVSEGTRVNSNGITHTDPAVNGEPVAAAPPAAPAPAPGNRVEQAEMMADHLARQVSAATAVVGRGFVRFLARIREEAEDVWAEAQNIRKKDKS
jgi:hypothetical protein